MTELNKAPNELRLPKPRSSPSWMRTRVITTEAVPRLAPLAMSVRCAVLGSRERNTIYGLERPYCVLCIGTTPFFQPIDC